MKKGKRLKRKCDIGVTPSDTTARIEKPILPTDPLRYKHYEREQPIFSKDDRNLYQRQQSDIKRSEESLHESLYTGQHLWGGIGGPVGRNAVPLRYEQEKANAMAIVEGISGDAAIGAVSKIIKGGRLYWKNYNQIKKIKAAAKEPINIADAKEWINQWNQNRRHKFLDLVKEKFNGNISTFDANQISRNMVAEAKGNLNSSKLFDLKNPKDKSEFFEIFKKHYDDPSIPSKGNSAESRYEDFIKEYNKHNVSGAYWRDSHSGAIFDLGGQSSAIHEGTHAQRFSAVENKIGKTIEDLRNPHKYLDESGEIYSRLMQTRNDLTNKNLLSPFRNVNSSDIQKFRNSLKDLPSRQVLDRYNDDMLLKLFNKVPVATGTAGVGAAALGSQEYNEGKTSTNMNKKRIKKNLPKYQLGTTPAGLSQTRITNIGNNTGVPNITGPMPKLDIAGAVSGAMGALTSQFNVWGGKTELSEQPAIMMARGPIQYQKSAYVNSERELKNLSQQNTGATIGSTAAGAQLGATVGAVAGPIGGAIGGAVGAVGGLVSGIFGGKSKKRKLKREIARQNQRITQENQFNLSDAHSNILQQEYLSEHGDVQNEALYNKGKTKCDDGKSANALVGNGETIVDGNTGELEEVTQGQGVGIDDVPATIQPEDAIAGNLTNPRTGNTFAEDMKPLTRMEKRLKRNSDRNIQSIADNTAKITKAYTQPLAQQLLAEQAMEHYKCGKSKGKYAIGKSGKKIFGTIGNVMGGVAEAGTALAPSLYNLFQGAQRSATVSPDQLYSTNAQLPQAMNLMAQRRYNIQPQLEALRGLERRQRYNARQMGSESGIGRAMDMAGGLNLQRAISDIYGNKQNIENQYLADRAQMGAQYGAQEASNRSQAMSSAYDINARNRAARKAYTGAGLTGISEYSQMQRKLRNQQGMDDMRMRMLEKYYEGNMDQYTSDYMLGR